MIFMVMKLRKNKKNEMGKKLVTCERVSLRTKLTRMSIKIFSLIVMLFITSCAKSKDFNYGLAQINALDSKYNTSIESYPKNIKDINQMLNDFSQLKAEQLSSGKEQFNYVIDYRVLNLEAEKLYIQSQRYGDLGTTRKGFGCKLRPIITESVSLRNQSALKGFEAVNSLREFASKYLSESNLTGLSEKNALFLNATFYQISKDASRDSGIINYFCPENVTLEIYKQQFKKEGDLSEDKIKNLTYDEAVSLWKKGRGIQ